MTGWQQRRRTNAAVDSNATIITTMPWLFSEERMGETKEAARIKRIQRPKREEGLSERPIPNASSHIERRNPFSLSSAPESPR